MKSIKQIKTSNGLGFAHVTIIFEDGEVFAHAITRQEFDELQEGDRMEIECIIAKYRYQDSCSVVSVWRYLNVNKKICASPCGHMCGQCKHFQQTGVYYSESSMGCPMDDSWPHPVGECKKHGFGPRLSAYHSADGKGCGWEIADWCKLDDRKLTEEEEKKLRQLWK